MVAAPYFTVSYSCVDTNGTTQSQAETAFVEAGSAYELIKPDFSGYTFSAITGGAEHLTEVGKNLSLVLIYNPIQDGINEAQSTHSGNNTLYDLEGRQTPKVSKKGIYIRNCYFIEAL